MLLLLFIAFISQQPRLVAQQQMEGIYKPACEMLTCKYADSVGYLVCLSQHLNCLVLWLTDVCESVDLNLTDKFMETADSVTQIISFLK